MVKIKIAHIVNDLNVGGVTSIVKELVINKSNDFEVLIINLSGKIDSKTYEIFMFNEIKVYNLNYDFHDGYSLISHLKNAYSPGRRAKKNIQTQELLKTISPDIIHLHLLPFELGVFKKIANDGKRKVIYTDHLVRAKHNEIGNISGLILGIVFKKLYSDIILIPVGPAVKKFHKEFGIVQISKLYKEIFNKIPARKERILVEKKEALNFVYVARISAVKGHLDLIEAWSELPEMNLTLYIVGPDEMGGAINRKVEELKCRNKIVFTASISDVPHFLLGMDVGLFPSYKEGLPIALLEKMQVGIPCIVSDIDELASVIEDEKTGLIYPLGNRVSLKEKIVRLAMDIELRKMIGENAIKSINQNYVSQEGGLAKEYESFYQEIMKIH